MGQNKHFSGGVYVCDYVMFYLYDHALRDWWLRYNLISEINQLNATHKIGDYSTISVVFNHLNWHCNLLFSLTLLPTIYLVKQDLRSFFCLAIYRALLYVYISNGW